jgi:hypothetical protein
MPIAVVPFETKLVGAALPVTVIGTSVAAALHEQAPQTLCAARLQINTNRASFIFVSTCRTYLATSSVPVPSSTYPQNGRLPVNVGVHHTRGKTPGPDRSSSELQRASLNYRQKYVQARSCVIGVRRQLSTCQPFYSQCSALHGSSPWWQSATAHAETTIARPIRAKVSLPGMY